MKYYSSKAVTQILGVTAQTLRNWDKEGKLNRFELEMFSFNKVYIEDIEGYIAEKVKQAEKIKQISEEYRELAEEYNNNLCDGFKEADWSRTNNYFKFGF